MTYPLQFKPNEYLNGKGVHLNISYNNTYKDSLILFNY